MLFKTSDFQRARAVYETAPAKGTTNVMPPPTKAMAAVRVLPIRWGMRGG